MYLELEILKYLSVFSWMNKRVKTGPAQVVPT